MRTAHTNLIVTIVIGAILIIGMVRLNALGFMSPRSSKTMSTVITKDKKSRLHQILAFGDSLTAGTTTSFVNYPYSEHLQQELLDRGWNVQVHHRGMPGWTAEQMLLSLDSNTTGLRQAIKSMESLEMVIILVGTNDLGRGYPSETIVENVIRLHQVCHENNVWWTIAVAVPPSAYQSRVTEAANTAAIINEGIEEFCANDGKSIFMPFPFPFAEKGENWDRDGLHFSPMGYQNLGKSLAPVVESILSRADG